MVAQAASILYGGRIDDLELVNRSVALLSRKIADEEVSSTLDYSLRHQNPQCLEVESAHRIRLGEQFWTMLFRLFDLIDSSPTM